MFAGEGRAPLHRNTDWGVGGWRSAITTLVKTPLENRVARFVCAKKSGRLWGSRERARDVGREGERQREREREREPKAELCQHPPEDLRCCRCRENLDQTSQSWPLYGLGLSHVQYDLSKHLSGCSLHAQQRQRQTRRVSGT